MLLKPISFLDKGNINPYEQSYVGEVIDNNDPEKLKRLKIYIPIWDMYTDEQLQWVSPASTSSASPNVDKHDIPEIGSTVKVFFENQDPENPKYTGASVTEATKCSLFDEDYPNTYGEKDSIGNFVMHNKKTGISLYHHNSGTEVQMDPDGTWIITGKSGCYAICDGKGNFKVSGSSLEVIADDEINLMSTRITIGAKNSLVMTSDFIEINGKSKIEHNSDLTLFKGHTCTFNNLSVNVVNAFSVDGAASYTTHDPFGKVTAQWVNGILVSKQKW